MLMNEYLHPSFLPFFLCQIPCLTFGKELKLDSTLEVDEMVDQQVDDGCEWWEGMRTSKKRVRFDQQTRNVQLAPTSPLFTSYLLLLLSKSPI